MRLAMDRFPGGRDALVAAHVQALSVTACALIYGDLRALGALPHISNARRSPDQDAILELEFEVRMEMEASIATLFVQGGDVIPAKANAEASMTAAGDQRKCPNESAALTVESETAEAPSDGLSEVDKEVMKIRKKLREIDKLKQRPPAELEANQLSKLETEDALLTRLAEIRTGRSRDTRDILEWAG